MDGLMGGWMYGCMDGAMVRWCDAGACAERRTTTTVERTRVPMPALMKARARGEAPAHSPSRTPQSEEQIMIEAMCSVQLANLHGTGGHSLSVARWVWH